MKERVGQGMLSRVEVEMRAHMAMECCHAARFQETGRRRRLAVSDSYAPLWRIFCVLIPRSAWFLCRDVCVWDRIPCKKYDLKLVLVESFSANR